MCSLRIERKGLKFIQKERKDLLFLGFFEGQKNALIFFFLVSSRKNKITCTNKKRLAIYFCCDHHRLRICRCFSEEREREREREDEDDGKGSDDESEEEEDRSERFMGFDRE
jgi:hypothetical protein